MNPSMNYAVKCARQKKKGGTSVRPLLPAGLHRPSLSHASRYLDAIPSFQ
jgi:hypothetical protein